MLEKISHLKTLIRADSSATIGHGHIRRDLVLARKFNDVSFACVRAAGDIFDEINYPKFELNSADLDELVNLINKLKFELIIIDHYGIDAVYERELKERTGVKILSFDDDYREHFCDVLLNVNLYADPLKYAALVPASCEICCGREFMLVRDEFYTERGVRRAKIYDYFIALGGTDTLNLSGEIARTLLAREPNLCLAVVTTSANANLAQLENLARETTNLRLFIDSQEVAKLMNESRELIVSASSLVNEALVLGAKFRAVRVADNQNELYKWLIKNDFLAYKSDEICEALI